MNESYSPLQLNDDEKIVLREIVQRFDECRMDSESAPTELNGIPSSRPGAGEQYLQIYGGYGIAAVRTDNMPHALSRRFAAEMAVVKTLYFFGIENIDRKQDSPPKLLVQYGALYGGSESEKTTICSAYFDNPPKNDENGLLAYMPAEDEIDVVGEYKVPIDVYPGGNQRYLPPLVYGRHLLQVTDILG